MRWGERNRDRLLRAGSVFAAGASVLALAACGGGGSSKSTSTTTASSTTTPTTTKAKVTPRPKPTLEVELGKVGSKAFGPTLSATPGEPIEVRVLVPGKGKHGGGAQLVSLDLATGQSHTLKVSAHSGHHSASGTITSANGKALTLTRLHFVCALPPAPTFCPGKSVTADSKGDHVKFSASRKTPIALVGTVGPVNLPIPKASTPSGSIVPAYKVSELVKVLPKNPKAAANTPPTASTTVKPGDNVLLISRVTGRIRGAAQTLTVTIDQGPGKSLTVTAAVPSGAPSSATLTSSHGKIAVVEPRYTCFLPPFPTFCPALGTSAKGHTYTLKFGVAPGASPPVLLVAVQSA
jgi:hypothetical protein